MTTSKHDPALELDEESGPPYGTVWTLEISGNAGWSGDLEQAAPLPRIGDTIELIERDGSRRRLQVHDVVHVLQHSASGRPAVREERSGPNSIVADEDEAGHPRLLRAGLPRVVASAVEADE